MKKRRLFAFLLALSFVLAFLCACTTDNGISEKTVGEYPQRPSGAVDIYFISVGKGDAAIICGDDTAIMVDTGENTAEKAVSAAITATGITSLDALFLSHDHDDHIGNFKLVKDTLEVGCVYYPAIAILNKKGENIIKEKAKKFGLEKDALRAGDKGTLAGGITYEVIGPIKADQNDNNNNSLVVRFAVNGRSVMFTGDMEFREEQDLLESGADLSADVLKVGNHGNPDATSKQFAEAVDPSVAVISTLRSVDPDSAGARVMSVLSGAKVYITDTVTGGILVRILSDGTIETYKVNS